MFKFSDVNLKKIEEILAKYPDKRSTIMSLLWIAQEQDGENILSKDKIEHVADFLKIPVINVYEVASFYTMYNMKDVGRFHIQICGTVPCHLVGAVDLLKTCKTILGVDKNTVTSDGKFSFSEVECLGACVDAPVIQVNNKEYYEKVDKNKLINIINDFSNIEK